MVLKQVHRSSEFSANWKSSEIQLTADFCKIVLHWIHHDPFPALLDKRAALLKSNSPLHVAKELLICVLSKTTIEDIFGSTYCLRLIGWRCIQDPVLTSHANNFEYIIISNEIVCFLEYSAIKVSSFCQTFQV